MQTLLDHSTVNKKLLVSAEER